MRGRFEVLNMLQPLVSVVIPNYNYAHYLPQAIDSVLSQSYPRVEVIVVDDGSKDESTTIVEKYGERVRLIRQQNQGVAAARNRGVAESSGEFIAFLDADDVWLPTKLERQVARFQNEPNLGLVHCGVEEIDENGAYLRTCLDGLEGQVAADLLLLKRAVILGGGSALMVPREVFTTIGGFDVRLSTSADWDLFYRLAAHRPVGFVHEVLVGYRMHGSNMHGNIRLMEHDMLLAYSKAFSDAEPEMQRLRRKCYGALHLTLAGSYFRSGKHLDFTRHMLKSLWRTPESLIYALAFPARYRRRARLQKKGPGPTSPSSSNNSRTR